MRPPVFVIGAQKAGTTTLTMDLMACEDLFVDIDKKESSQLTAPHSDTWMQEFEREYARCMPHQRPVDVSTRYSMYPDETVDPKNAQSWGDETLIVYIVRDRVERAISHHHHDTSLGLTDLPIDEALQPARPFVQNSLYADQMTQWLEMVEPKQVAIVSFEGYVDNRRAVVEELCVAANVRTAGSETIDASAQFNKTAGRHTPQGLIRRVASSRTYRAARTHIPSSVRQLAKSALTRPAPDRLETPLESTIATLAPLFEADERALRELLPGSSFCGFA